MAPGSRHIEQQSHAPLHAFYVVGRSLRVLSVFAAYRFLVESDVSVLLFAFFSLLGAAILFFLLQRPWKGKRLTNTQVNLADTKATPFRHPGNASSTSTSRVLLFPLLTPIVVLLLPFSPSVSFSLVFSFSSITPFPPPFPPPGSLPATPFVSHDQWGISVMNGGVLALAVVTWAYGLKQCGPLRSVMAEYSGAVVATISTMIFGRRGHRVLKVSAGGRITNGGTQTGTQFAPSSLLSLLLLPHLPTPPARERKPWTWRWGRSPFQAPQNLPSPLALPHFFPSPLAHTIRQGAQALDLEAGGRPLQVYALVILAGLVFSFYVDTLAEDKLRIGPSSLKHLLVTSVAVVALLLIYRMHFCPLSFVLIALLLAAGLHWSTAIERSKSAGSLAEDGVAAKERRRTAALAMLQGAMDHVMSDSKSHRIALFLLINAAFMIVEFSVGFLSNSLGLISDACHMLFDCAALAIGLYASYISRLDSPSMFAYGYGRFEVLSGFVNAVFLVLIATLIVFESIERILDPPDISTANLLAVSVGGLVVNMVGLVFFHEAHHHAHGGTCSHSHDHDHSHSHVHDHSHSHSHHGHEHKHEHGHAHGGSCTHSHHDDHHHHHHEHQDNHSHHNHDHDHEHKHEHEHELNHRHEHAHTHDHDCKRHAHQHEEHHHHEHHTPHYHHKDMHGCDHGHGHGNGHRHEGGSALEGDEWEQENWEDARSNSAMTTRSLLQSPISVSSPSFESPALPSSGAEKLLAVHKARRRIGEGGAAAVGDESFQALPACSIFISALIISTVIPLLQNSAEIILQRVPRAAEHQISAALKKIESMAGVVVVRQRHFWSFTPKMLVGSIHVLISPDSLKDRANEGGVAAHNGDAYSEYGDKQRRLEAVQQLRQSLRRRVSDVFRAVGITHVTVEVGTARCTYLPNSAPHPTLHYMTASRFPALAHCLSSCACAYSLLSPTSAFSSLSPMPVHSLLRHAD
ncbi:unnamed protein product [Closterium sp. Yama58-4]|nr:unnamed protein product [Closterium sp. Yama58-4]